MSPSIQVFEIYSQIAAHEIGHTLNLHHDFKSGGGHEWNSNDYDQSDFCGRYHRYCPSNGVSCTDIGGFMDYPFPGDDNFEESCSAVVSSVFGDKTIFMW